VLYEKGGKMFQYHLLKFFASQSSSLGFPYKDIQTKQKILGKK